MAPADSLLDLFYVRREAALKRDCWTRVEVAERDRDLLLAAVEHVLKLHQPGRIVVLGAVCKKHEQYPNFSITGTEAQHLKDCPDCTATTYASCTCGHIDIEHCPHRLVITGELAKEESHDQRPV